MAATFVSLSATGQVKLGGPGKLIGIWVSSGTNPTVAVYDGTADTDPKIIATSALAVGNYPMPAVGVGYSKGLYVVLAGTNPVVSIFYE